MSFESEVTYLKANCPFAEGEALQLAFQGSITGAGFNGWEGLIAISQHKLFFSSEPGFVSNGGVVWAAFDSLASISRTGARVHVELYINGKTSIDVHVNGFATPDVKQNVEQMVEYARRCRCHTVQTPITDEFSAAMDVEDDERAILLLESVGTKDNLSVLPHSFIALFLTRVGRHDEAVRAVEEAKRRGLAQLSLVAWIHCCAHRAQGEVHEMEREASRVLSELGNAEGPFAVMEPEVLRGWALDALLDCQVHLEKWALALQTTAALESACPDHSGSYLTRVRIALVMEDVPLAEEALRAYRAHENHVPAEAKFSEAMIRWAKDDRDAAIELAHSVLDEYPQAMEVIHALLEWLGTAKRYEDVLCTARRALDAFEEPDPYVLTTQANAFLRLNRPAEALEAGDHALRLATGENFHALVFGGLVRADALAELGRGEDALGAVQSVREASTIIPDGLVQQQWRRRWEYCLALVEAKALCGLERYEQALPLLRIAARLPPEEGELHDEIDRLQQRAREKLDARADHAAPSEELRPVAGLSLFGKRNEAQRKLSVLHRRLAVDARLAELADEAKQLKDYYDRPLLLAILGEFNAGKSTFINALLGEDLLPTDVVPTTATINRTRSTNRVGT